MSGGNDIIKTSIEMGKIIDSRNIKYKFHCIGFKNFKPKELKQLKL